MIRKKIFIVIGGFIFLLLIMSGQYINNNPNVSEMIFIYGLIDLVIMSLIMMIIPTVYRLINKKS